MSDLRAWVRRKVEDANAKAQSPAAIHNLREFNVHPKDRLGGAKFSGYAPPALLALLDAVWKPARKPAHEPGYRDDHRMPTQRRADCLIEALRNFSATQTQNRSGVTSIVVSMTVDDVLKLNEATDASVQDALCYQHQCGADRFRYHAPRCGPTGLHRVAHAHWPASGSRPVPALCVDRATHSVDRS
ncbi:DUF222 domain-containing protein [Corynebacterium atypicum]|uniref:DUF222 domain-containing protein n=1 Tax=Corynebacterium atypicum TaxID=191610 RepID=UPI0038992427